MNKFLFPLLYFLIIFPAKAQEQEFSFTGKTDEIANGNYLYIHDLMVNKTLDSAVIEDGTFKFETNLENAPLFAMIHTGDRKHFKQVWLEDTSMTLDASGTDFKNAKITGSKSHELNRKLYENVDELSAAELTKKQQVFVKEHPNSIISAETLYLYSNKWGRDLTTALFENFSVENKGSRFGNKILAYLRTDESPQIGEKFIDFSLPDPYGNMKKLSEVNDDIILLQFWGTWCAPSREANKNLLSTYKEFQSKGFEIFAVALKGNKEVWQNMIENDDLQWQHVRTSIGKKDENISKYGIRSTPDNFLIDHNGKIIARDIRGEELEEKLTELLNEEK